MKTDISEKKPAGADFSAKDSAKNPAGKPAKSSEKSADKPAKEPAKKSAGKRAAFSAKKPARKFAGHSAGKSAGNPAEESAWKPAEKYTEKKRAAKPAWKSAEGKPHASKTTAANSAAKKPKANPAELKPASTGRTVPADETAFLRTLGLAARARQTVMGTDMVCDALAEGRVRLVVEAGDTSENTHKRLTDKCITYRTPHVRLLSDGGTLGAALGKSGALAVCGVTGEIAKSLFSAWERLTASAPAVPEKVAKTKK